MSAATTSPSLNKPIRVGIFSTIEAADRAVANLLNAGFSKDEITVICSNDVKEAHFREFEHQEPAGAHTPVATLAGGAIGATLGGLTVLIGAVATGGIGLVAAGGIAAWAGGIVGGLVGAMMTRGVEKELANFYDQAVARGKILVAAEREGGDQVRMRDLAARILAEAGAEPISLPEG